jgi:thiol:disulfide interchange protein
VPNGSFRFRLLAGCAVVLTALVTLIRPMWALEAFTGLAVAVGALWLWTRDAARCFAVFVRLAAVATALMLVVVAMQTRCSAAKPSTERAQSARGQPSEHYYKDEMKQTLQRAAARARQ